MPHVSCRGPVYPHLCEEHHPTVQHRHPLELEACGPLQKVHEHARYLTEEHHSYPHKTAPTTNANQQHVHLIDKTDTVPARYCGLQLEATQQQLTDLYKNISEKAASANELASLHIKFHALSR
eukprot:scaffold35552_cov19-Tisochrysis_lutea.AAC.1